MKKVVFIFLLAGLLSTNAYADPFGGIKNTIKDAVRDLINAFAFPVAQIGNFFDIITGHSNPGRGDIRVNAPGFNSGSATSSGASWSNANSSV